MTDNVYIIVPAYNEQEVILSTVEGLLQSFRSVIVVNDGSTDNTLAILRDLDVLVVNHLINIGQGAALQTGITFALEQGADIIVSFDADGQHQVSDVTDMIARIRQQDCDVLLGSRFLGKTVGMSTARKILLKFAISLSNLTNRTRLTDAHNGLRVMTREAAACLDISQFGMAHASEIIQQFQSAGMRIKEYPVTIHYTEYSIAKGQRSLNAVNVLLDLLMGRFSK